MQPRRDDKFIVDDGKRQRRVTCKFARLLIRFAVWLDSIKNGKRQ